MRTALLAVLALCVGMAIKSGDPRRSHDTQEAIEQAAEVAYANHDYRLSQNLRSVSQIHSKGMDEQCFVNLRLFITGQLDDAIKQILVNSAADPSKK